MGAHSAAVQTAALVVTSGGLSRIGDAIMLSRRIARRNLTLVFAYNTVMLPMSVLGLIGPVAAAAVMLASAASVILSSVWVASWC